MNRTSSLSQFTQKVIQVVQSVPQGGVVSYGQVAAYVGVPRGARQVGWIMRSLEEVHMPWWRVINNAGLITIKGNKYNDKIIQKKLLEADGIYVANNFRLDIKKYRYKANDNQLKKWGLPATYREMVLVKYGL